MPLLGRYKSSSASSGSPPAGSSSSNAKASQQAAPASPNRGSQVDKQVCESPLFGIRRQLTISSTTSSSEKTQPMSSSAQTTTELSGSIPQQISKQQIHYAFSIMDTNQDGMIDLRDLSQMLANLGVPIDEAILSHIMSTVSKRGDHRISEAEFLDWLGLFIQISDAAGAAQHASEEQQQQQQQRKQKPARSSRAPAGSSRGVARSATAASSLAAEPAAQAANLEGAAQRVSLRRGSGSGLALMRSLSSGSPATQTQALATTTSATSGSAPATASSSRQNSGSPRVRRKSRGQLTREPSDCDARDDLKAAFCVFDLDGDGFITLDELRAGLKLLGENWSPVELAHVFSVCGSKETTPLEQHNKSKQTQRQQRINIDDFVKLLL